MSPRTDTPAPFARIVIVHGTSGDKTPVYSVVINGDGQLLYKGRSGVPLKGRHERRLEPATMEAMARVLHDSGLLARGQGPGEITTENGKLTVALKMPGGIPVVVDHTAGDTALEVFVAGIEQLAGLGAEAQQG